VTATHRSAGFVRLTLPAPVPAGIPIKLRHAELLMHPPYGPKDGNIYVGNLRSALATDLYTTGGVSEGFEVFEPVFTYHGFRFVEVTGLPFAPTIDMLTGVHIRTGVQMAGNVVAPSLTAAPLNQLQHAIQWGLANNFMSVISDCPQRDERKGWMGDSGLSLQPTHYNYHVGAFYTAWAANIRDSQVYKGDGHPDGSVADTTPHTFGSYPSDPAWGTAYPGIVYSTWRMLGDTRIASDHYPNLQMYIAFMTARTNSSGPGKIYQSYGEERAKQSLCSPRACSFPRIRLTALSRPPVLAYPHTHTHTHSLRRRLVPAAGAARRRPRPQAAG
jgi:alpha-L-rhamnosidase